VPTKQHYDDVIFMYGTKNFLFTKGYCFFNVCHSETHTFCAIDLKNAQISLSLCHLLHNITVKDTTCSCACCM